MVTQRFSVTFWKRKISDDTFPCNCKLKKSNALTNLSQIYDLLFHTKRKNNCLAISESQVYESWNYGLVLITGVSKDTDIGFWMEELYFKKHILNLLLPSKKLWV